MSGWLGMPLVAWVVSHPSFVYLWLSQESSEEEEESDEEEEEPAAAKGTKRKADAANGKKVSRCSWRL